MQAPGSHERVSSAEDGNTGPGDPNCEGHRRPHVGGHCEQLRESACPDFMTSQEEAGVNMEAELASEIGVSRESCTATQGPHWVNEEGMGQCSQAEGVSEPRQGFSGSMPSDPAENLADVVVAEPEGGDAFEVRALGGIDKVSYDYPRIASTSEVPRLSADWFSGSVQDMKLAFAPLVTENSISKGDDLHADENRPVDWVCATPLTPIHRGRGECASTTSPPNLPEPEPEPPRAGLESDDDAVDFGMEAALDVMLSGGQLTEAQLAALKPHIIGASSEWDVPAADGTALDLEALIPDLALGDWDMEELLRDSGGCMLGLEDYLAHSAAHTTTPADLPEAIPNLEALELYMLGLEEYLLPLADLEAPAGSNTVASLGLDLNFDRASQPLDVTEGALCVSVGGCEATLPVGGGFGFGRLGLVAVDPTMFESYMEEAMPELDLDSGATCINVGTGRLDSIDASRQTITHDDGVVPQEGHDAISQLSALSADVEAANYSAVSPTPSGSSQLHARSENFLSEVTSMEYDTLAGSLLMDSTTEAVSGPSSLGTGITRRPSLSRSSRPPNIPVRNFASPVPLATASSIPTVHLLPPCPKAPRIPPIALPSLDSTQTTRAISPQPVPAPSLDLGSNASRDTNAPDAPPDLVPRTEAAWSTMFRQLKQTKKATPVRRRIGVLRRYEEGREYWHNDTGAVHLEVTMEEGDSIEAISQGGSSGRRAIVDTAASQNEPEEEGAERDEGPEVIVIEDSNDEQSAVGECLSSPLSHTR